MPKWKYPLPFRATGSLGTVLGRWTLSYRYSPHSTLLESISDAITAMRAFPRKGLKLRSCRGKFPLHANGNLTANPDKGINHIRYNHLTARRDGLRFRVKKLHFAYSAEGQLLYRKLEKRAKHWIGPDTSWENSC